MDTKAALGAAGGIALTVAGGVSALLLTMGPSGASPAEVENEGTAVVTQYVDENGNPIDAPSVADTSTSPEVVVIGPDGQPVDTALQTDAMADGEMEAAYEAEEYPEDVEHEEDEDDYEDGDDDEEEEDD